MTTGKRPTPRTRSWARSRHLVNGMAGKMAGKMARVRRAVTVGLILALVGGNFKWGYDERLEQHQVVPTHYREHCGPRWPWICDRRVFRHADRRGPRLRLSRSSILVGS